MTESTSLTFCRVEANCISRLQWVSLKVMTADTQDSRELHNLKFLERRSAGSLSSGYIVQLLDFFIHKGPNGDHQCIIFELLGPSVDRVLADYHQGRDTLDPQTILRMSKQLLKAVEFIHSAGMCHGGGMPVPQTGRWIRPTDHRLRHQRSKHRLYLLSPIERNRATTFRRPGGSGNRTTGPHRRYAFAKRSTNTAGQGGRVDRLGRRG